MSINIIADQIKKFLSSSEPEVLAIRGPWGAGKTFTWNNLIKQHKKEIELTKYAYVSLFGINTLNELKTAIFTKIIDKKLLGEPQNIESLAKNTWAVLASFAKKGKNVAESIPAVGNFSKIIDEACFFFVKKIILCIDDFERKGKDLALRDVLGLISMLKEQKECKVTLIFNDEAFHADDAEEYKKFREKVIDKELMFNPTPIECCKIAFDEEDAVHKKITDFSCKLGINNIRILKKISSLAVELSSLLLKAKCREETLNQGLHSLSLLCLCFYSKSQETPPYEYLKNIGTQAFYSSEKKSPKEEKWLAFLKNYDFLTLDDFDRTIAKAVESGFFDEKFFLAEAKKLDDQFKLQNSKESLRNAWAPYHSSFNDNEVEVINSLKNCLYDHYQIFTPAVLDPSICLISNLGHKELADELINFYINKLSDNQGMRVNLTQDGESSINGIKDKALLEKLNNYLQTALPTEKVSPREILLNIHLQKSWSNTDENILANTTSNSFYSMFKAEQKELNTLVYTVLKFGSMTPQKTNYLKIAANAKEALIRIGNESPLNKMRVEKFGIELSPTDITEKDSIND